MSKYKKLLKELDYVENEDDNNLVLNLLSVPKRDKPYEAANTTTLKPNTINQADLLFLPLDYTPVVGDKERCKKEFKKVNAIRKKMKQKVFKKDGGYRYLLVVVDTANGMIDAEPIKYKYSFIVRDAMKRIYARKTLIVPKVIEVDDGGEFKDEFDLYFNTVSQVRHKKSGRHRAQAVVEGVNSLLSKLIQTRMIGEEINTGEASLEWVEDMPKIIKATNKYFVHDPPIVDEEKHIPIKCKSGTMSCDVLELNTPVRIQLDNPVDAVKTKRLHGKFRIGDIRFENKVRYVTQLFLRPDFPPMYKVDEFDVGFTRKQLQVVKSDEKKPSSKLQKKHIVAEILDRVKIKNKVHFKLRYEDGDLTTEPRSELMKFIPGMVEEYEEYIKKVPVIMNSFKKNRKTFFNIKWKNGKETVEERKEFDERFPTLVTKFDDLSK